MPTFDLVVWDFDGVLNANIVDGRFVWSDTLQQDLGVDPRAFQAFLFESGRMLDVIKGAVCLRELVQTWLADTYPNLGVDTFLSYWFAKDARPDHEVVQWLERAAGRKVIGTNNEALRSAYIETEMGFADRVERVFSSGRMKIAKPDPAFFEHIAAWAGTAPEQCLLVDDSPANVETARRLGWQAFHFCDGSRASLPSVLGIAA